MTWMFFGEKHGQSLKSLNLDQRLGEPLGRFIVTEGKEFIKIVICIRDNP